MRIIEDNPGEPFDTDMFGDGDVLECGGSLWLVTDQTDAHGNRFCAKLSDGTLLGFDDSDLVRERPDVVVKVGGSNG